MICHLLLQFWIFYPGRFMEFENSWRKSSRTSMRREWCTWFHLQRLSRKSRTTWENSKFSICIRRWRWLYSFRVKILIATQYVWEWYNKNKNKLFSHRQKQESILVTGQNLSWLCHLGTNLQTSSANLQTESNLNVVAEFS